MRTRGLVSRCLAAAIAVHVLAPVAVAQTRTPAKDAKPSRARSLAGKLADTALTSAASLGADSLLGTNAAAMAQMAGATGAAPCAGTGGAAGAVASIAAAPSAGGLLVGVAKKRLLGGKAKKDAAAPDSAAAPCPDGTAPGTSSALRTVGTAALAASPAGLAVTAGAAAAPHAGKAIRSLRARLGRGGASRESMTRALEAGRLELSGITFAPGSADAADGFEAVLAPLVEALQAVDGKFVLHVSPEGRDAAMAAKRAAAIAMHLQLAGIDAARVTVGAAVPSADASAPARVTIVRREARP